MRERRRLRLNALQRLVRSLRKYDDDRLTWVDGAAGEDHSHDAGPANHSAAVVVANEFFEQARAEILDLRAGIAQACQLHHGVVAKVQQGASRKFQQIDASGGDILPEFPGSNAEPSGFQPLEEFLLYQVNLAQIQGGGICPDAREVLNGDAAVGISGHAKPRLEVNLTHRFLAEAMRGVEVDG